MEINDKLSKLRNHFYKLNFNFKKFGIFNKNISIDGKMVLYKSTTIKRCLWTVNLCASGINSGYIYSCSGYCGKSSMYDKQLRLGESFVDDLKDVPDVRLFFDNFFSFHILFAKLTDSNIKRTGKIRENNISKCPIDPNASWR